MNAARTLDTPLAANGMKQNNKNKSSDMKNKAKKRSFVKEVGEKIYKT